MTKCLIVAAALVAGLICGSCALFAAVGEENAVQIAIEHAREIYGDLPYMKGVKPKAVFVQDENAWIIWFVATDVPPDGDIMVQIDAATGQFIKILGGALKAKYRPYFS